MVAYKVIDGVLAGFYKYFEAILAVTPERYGAVVKWNVDYEKVNECLNLNLCRRLFSRPSMTWAHTLPRPRRFRNARTLGWGV